MGFQDCFLSCSCFPWGRRRNSTSSTTTAGNQQPTNSTSDQRSTTTQELAAGSSSAPDDTKICNSFGEPKSEHEKAVSEPATMTSDPPTEESMPGTISNPEELGNSSEEPNSEVAKKIRKIRSKKSFCYYFRWGRKRRSIPSPNTAGDDQPTDSTSDQRSVITKEVAGSPTPDERPTGNLCEDKSEVEKTDEEPVDVNVDPKSLSNCDSMAESINEDLTFSCNSTDEENSDSHNVMVPSPDTTNGSFIKYQKGIRWFVPFELLEDDGWFSPVQTRNSEDALSVEDNDFELSVQLEMIISKYDASKKKSFSENDNRVQESPMPCPILDWMAKFDHYMSETAVHDISGSMFPKSISWFIPFQILNIEDNLIVEDKKSELSDEVIARNKRVRKKKKKKRKRKTLHFDELVKISRVRGFYDDFETKPEYTGFQMSYGQLKLGPRSDGGLAEERASPPKKLIQCSEHCDSKVNVPLPQVIINKDNTKKAEKDTSESRPGFGSKIQNLVHERSSWEDEPNYNPSSSTSQKKPPDYPPPPPPIDTDEPVDPEPESSEPLDPPVIKNETVNIDPVHEEPEDKRAIDDVGKTGRVRRTMSMDHLLELYAPDDGSF